MLISQGYVIEKPHDPTKDPMIQQEQQKPRKPVEDGMVIVDCGPLLRRYRLHRCIPKENSKVWCVKDICGVICVILTWFLIMYAEFAVMLIMLMPNQYPWYKWGNIVLFNFLTFMAVASHSRAMLSDPGAVPKGNATKEIIMKLSLKGKDLFKCPKCISIKPDRAHHCSICKRCIKKMDHHCPWVNNCVGENNQKYFVLFTMYICLSSIHVVFMSVQHFIHCIGKDWKGCSGVSPPAATLFLIFLVFEGLLFGLFTAIMFGSQLSSICSDETGIEQLKKDYSAWQKKSFWFSIKSVFGHPFSWRWFSPFSTPNYIYTTELEEYCV